MLNKVFGTLCTAGSGVGPSLGASRSAGEKHSRSSSSVGVAVPATQQQQQQQAAPQAAAAFSSNAASNSSSSSGAVKPSRPSLGRRRSSGGLGVALSSVLGLAGVQRRHIVENIQFEDISDKLYLAQGAMCDVFKGRLKVTGEVRVTLYPTVAVVVVLLRFSSSSSSSSSTVYD
jgi:hypothetical protein